jgi:hypothetical protein
VIGLPLYVLLFAIVCLPGLPIGFALFGRRHAAGWIAGALMGYAAMAVVLWGLVQAGAVSRPTVSLAIAAGIASGIGVTFARRRSVPWVELPRWTRRDTSALLSVLLLVPLLQWRPFSRIGEPDAGGAARYRAYFTADFLWHVALTAELTKHASPPRNPYLARRPLHYYWAYFVPPAFLAHYAPVLPDLKAHLLANALCAGLLFVASMYLLAWCIVPRAGPVAVAVTCVVVAASAEGAYALWDLWQRGRPLSSVRELNIDAITAWWFQTLTIDGLPRSLWYTPQHAMSCALSLVALILPASRARRPGAAAIASGIALGLALIVSPFLGGAFSVIYGLASVSAAFRRNAPGTAHDASGGGGWRLLQYALAALPVLLALGWCVGAGTFEGSGSAVAVGVSRAAAAAPCALLALALGPVLALAIVGLWLRPWRSWPLATPLLAAGTGLFMLYGVTLTLEPIWIGWRAGQIILVTLPALLAAALALLWDLRHRAVAVASVVLLLALGLPTTLIDAYNAQDVSNVEEAAGFRWTVVVPPDTQLALDWIRLNTPSDAVVQMSIGPRRRETWTLVPTFAERRMAAGRPISLLHTPEYDELSDQVDAMYRTTSPVEARDLARALRIDYLFVDRLERQAFGDEALAKFSSRCCFEERYSTGDAAVYAVR